jgi:hypothetical protein
MPNPGDHARAVVLATQISSVAPAPSIVDPRLRVPAIHQSVQNRATPLDLAADVFRYRVDGANRIVAVRVEDENGTGRSAGATSEARAHDVSTADLRHHLHATAPRGSGSHRWWSAGAGWHRRLR